MLLALLWAVLWAFSLILVRILGRTDSSITITAYLSLMMAPLPLPPALAVWQWPTLPQLGWLAVIGILGGGARIFLVEVLKRSQTNEIMPLDFLKLIWAVIIGMIVFQEMPDGTTLIGAIMIFAATAFSTARSDTTKGPPTSAANPV